MSGIDGPTPLREIYSEEQITAVGLLFLAAGVCEAGVSLQVARCLAHPGSPTIQMHLSAVGMEMKLKLQTIEYCVQIHKREELKRVEKITSSIRRLFQHRNHIAHNFNIPSSQNIEINVFKMTRQGFAKPKVFTNDQIEGFANLIHGRLRQLDDCLNEIGIERLARSSEPAQ